MRSQAFANNSVGRPGSAARPGTAGNNEPVNPSLITKFDDKFFKDRFQIQAIQKEALARLSTAIKASGWAKEEYDLYIGNFNATPHRATDEEDGRAAIRLHHFSKYIQYVAKYEEINNTSPLRTKLPGNIKPAVRRDFFALSNSERSRFLIALAEFKKSYQWRWIVGLATGHFTADEAVAGPNKQLKDKIHQGNVILVEKAQLHFKEFCASRSQPNNFAEHAFVQPVNGASAGSYATDATYTLWNRCLLAEFETILRTFDPDPTEPLALPYWSWETWLNPSQQQQNSNEEEEGVEQPIVTDFGALPTAFTAPFVQVTLHGKQSLIRNPLLDGLRAAPIHHAGTTNTARYPTFVDAFLEAQKVINDQYFQSLLRNEDFASASSQITLPSTNGAPVSAPHMATANIEAVTNYIQTLVGGESAVTYKFTPSPQTDVAEGETQDAPQAHAGTTTSTGDLATYERSSWDPLFWLIRANTDRLLCSWQRIHFRSSDAAATVPKNINGNTRLFPFARLEDLSQQRCWQITPNESSANPAGREMLVKKHTATMENWWSVVSLERYYSYDRYFELQSPEEFAQRSPRLKALLTQVPHQKQNLAGDHNNTELEVSIGYLPHSGQLFAFYQTATNGLRALGSVPVLASEEGTSGVFRFNILDLLTGPTENPKRSMPPRDLVSEPYWIQERLLLELRTANRTTVLDVAQHKIQAIFDFARFI